MKHTVGVFGLGVMGASLAKNLINHQEHVAVYNYTSDLTEEFIRDVKNDNMTAYFDLEEFLSSIEKPRKIFIMVTAGTVTDNVIDSITPFLDNGDLLMDGGNANFLDSNRRYHQLRELNIHFLSVGVSGGEQGALFGPALMPSGDQQAYDIAAPILKKIAAQVSGRPCCSYIGPEGSGHYVKMVHNGIEYADMQLITEAYLFLRTIVGLDVQEISDTFAAWNKTELKSYLIEITSNILKRVDPESGKPMIDIILDKAGQKGTGKWTSKNALDIGSPLSIITESVFARYISARKNEREESAKHLEGKRPVVQNLDKTYWIKLVKEALFIGKICTYAQGFDQYKQASQANDWQLKLDEIALNFRGGCIIRADFLNDISDAFQTDRQVTNLLHTSYFKDKANRYQSSLRKVAIKGMENGLSLPCFSSALTYYDGYRSVQSGANLIQAQRDYFGSHTYERVDQPGIFHTNW